MYNSETNTAWFKVANDFKVFDFKQKEILGDFKYGQGKYQFVIRACNVFNGSHGAKQFKHSIMFRICQLRFEKGENDSLFADEDCDGNINKEEDTTSTVKPMDVSEVEEPPQKTKSHKKENILMTQKTLPAPLS